VPEAEVTTAKAGYLGAIFLGPFGSVIPLILYVIKGRKSPFLRYHTATAANLSLTCLLYGVCCAILGGLLSLDSAITALVIASSIGLALWVTMLRYLIRGIAAANQDEPQHIPQWICAPMLG
jgi:uncharacterized Tic20 family protein